MKRLDTSILGVGLACSVLAILGCSSPAAPTNQVAAPTLLDALVAAPTSAVVDGQTFVISGDLYRNFMPTIGVVNPSALAGVAILRTNDSSPVAGSVTVDAVWAVYGTEIWTATPDPLERGITTLSARVGGGPQWPVAAVTQVIMRVKGTSGTQLVRVSNVVVKSVS